MNTDKSDELLRRLASAVVDGETVDWELEMSSDTGVQHRVHNLRLIQSIGDAHRDVRDDLLGRTQPQGRPDEWGKLEIRELLGSGSFGDVYRAWDPDLECEVALKLPDSHILPSGDQRRHFLREARQLAKVLHENVLRVLGADEHGGRAGIWTELIEGATLEKLLGQAGRFSADEATSIGIDLCCALAAVHAAGIVHRDVKTSNVLREEGGRIVLLDLGAAEDRMPMLDATQPQSALPGTPRFMAPEQLVDSKPATIQSDLYSLGVVLYRLVTVDFPVEATTIGELIECQRNGEAVPLIDRRPGLPGPFVQVVERMLATDPARRYASAGEAEQALEATRSGSPVALERPQDGGRGRWSKATWLSIAATVALVAVASFVGWNALRTQPLTVEATFYAVDENNPRRKLKPMSPVGFDDKVYLELTTSRTANVYVLNQDEVGSLFAMFPLRGYDLSNPLEANRKHQLPDAANGWVLSDAGDVETVFVIVSDEPFTEIEDLVARIPSSGEEVVIVEPDVVLRSFGQVRMRPQAVDVLPLEIAQLAGMLEDLAESDPGLFFETFYLRGPEGPKAPR